MARNIVFVLVLGLVAISFQNCSQANFDTQPETLENPFNNGTLTVNNATGEKTFTIRADTELRYPTDVLFVIDESVSMNAIATEVREGFAKLAGHAYPANTRMAVTNMAPALLNGSTPQFTTAYKNSAGVSAQPGFLRLVSRAGVDSFRTSYPSSAGQFPVKGCASSWFTPEMKDEGGVPCLVGAAQIAQLATGIEAGVTSFKQLLQKAGMQDAKLFRKDVALTVIFVSDTHDAGGAYYGKTGAEASMISYAALRQMVYQHEPTLKGLKFNAIVPLPRATNSVLNGVNVIGNLPLTAEEEIVSGEAVNGYSYLPFVAASGGSAMHIAKNDWGTAIAEMVKDIGVLQVPVLKLAVVANEIHEVKVNGVVLTPAQYTLQADKQTIQIPRQAGWGRYLDIQVLFK